MTTARPPGQPAPTPAQDARPEPGRGRPLPPAGLGHKGQKAPAPRRGPRRGRSLTWPSPRHALGFAPLATAMREPGIGPEERCFASSGACRTGEAHSWRDPEPPGAAIFLHSNAAAAAAALAGRRQHGVRMRRYPARRTRSHVRQHGGPARGGLEMAPCWEGMWSQAEVLQRFSRGWNSARGSEAGAGKRRTFAPAFLGFLEPTLELHPPFFALRPRGNWLAFPMA